MLGDPGDVGKHRCGHLAVLGNDAECHLPIAAEGLVLDSATDAIRPVATLPVHSENN